MEVILELSPENARDYQQHTQSVPMIQQLLATIDELKVIITPQYRPADDTTSNYFFVIQTRDWEECQRIAKIFDRLPAVDAAYCKPEEEPAYLP